MSNTSGLEIERKFLLAETPHIAVLLAHGAQPQQLVQYYLTSTTPDGPIRRLRILGVGSDLRYLYTEKRDLGGITREEVERAASPREAIALLAQADPAYFPIKKVRWTWREDGQTWELDLFESPADLVMLEVELSDADEAVTPPAWLGRTRDVSENPAYQNANLARHMAATNLD